MRRRRAVALLRPSALTAHNGHQTACEPTPFQTLVAHFVKRMLASEEDQGTGAVSLGLGAVLAILAAPGGFASIFLLDKYSTLLQWFRGQTNFNPYKASVADEYFFVVLSMTITGLVMVLRWNRLLPDYRDFANLAALPIPIRDVFLANFIALAALGVLFGIDVNAASAFLFPAIVTASDAHLLVFLRLAAAHAAAVFSASMFSFFAVFALVGVLMLVLPRRLFRPVSIGVRILLVVALLSEFLANMFLQLFSGRLPHLKELYLKWLPSYWFLGIYEHVAGFASQPMNALAREGIEALGAAIAIALGAYALCYRRHFLRLAESLELIGFTRYGFRVRLPQWMERILFRSEFEHACSSFTWKALARSEKHLMFLGGYLGIGAVLAAQMAADSLTGMQAGALPNSEWLTVPLVIAFMTVTGLRFAFDLPAALEANWVFRIGTDAPMPAPAEIARRFLLWAVVPWEILIAGAITAREFGWAIACEHVAMLVILTLVLIEAVLPGFRKIPFTCKTQLETRRALVKILGPVFGVLILAPALGSFERWILERPSRLSLLATFAGIVWYLFRRSRRDEGNRVIFEEQSAASFELLQLH